jgi:hypothetical protein
VTTSERACSSGTVTRTMKFETSIHPRVIKGWALLNSNAACAACAACSPTGRSERVTMYSRSSWSVASDPTVVADAFSLCTYKVQSSVLCAYGRNVSGRSGRVSTPQQDEDQFAKFLSPATNAGQKRISRG